MANPQPSRLLLVDDDTLLTWSLANALTRVGFQICVARSGESAISLLDAEHFDILVTDLELPGIGGREVVRHARALGKDLPAIIMSAAAGAGALAEREGADVFIEKPFDIYELVRSVQSLLAHSSDKAEPQI